MAFSKKEVKKSLRNDFSSLGAVSLYFYFVAQDLWRPPFEVYKVRDEDKL